MPEGVTRLRHVSLYSIDPTMLPSKAVGLNESVRAAVRAGKVASLNRVNESSFKLRSDNFCGCDLLAEHFRRSQLADEPGELGPQVPLVRVPLALPRRREGLAGRTSTHDGPVVWPLGGLQSQLPPGDSVEEVPPFVSPKVCCTDFLNWSFINIPFGYDAMKN
jgi:hypothetical protein